MNSVNIAIFLSPGSVFFRANTMVKKTSNKYRDKFFLLIYCQLAHKIFFILPIIMINHLKALQ